MNHLLMITGDRSLARGKEGAFYNTLQELSTHWDRIDVICPRVENARTEFFGNVFVHPSPTSLFGQPGFILRKGLELNRKHSISCMTVHEYPPFYNGLGARWLSRRTGIPYLLEFHHIPGYPRAATFKEDIYRLLAKIFVSWDSRAAKLVRVVNQHQTKEFLVEAGVSASKIKYIPSLYIDQEIFKLEEIQKEFDMIFVGRLEKNKGIRLFIEAAKELNAKAIIVGEGPEKENLRSLIGGDQNITLHGWAKDAHEVADLIRKSKVLLMTSYNEGGPRVVAEAMACGTPVVATPVGIVPDLAGGLSIVDWDSHIVAREVRELLDNSDWYEMRKKAGLEAAAKFEKKEMIRQYAESIKSLNV